jgi:hypothetical protein
VHAKKLHITDFSTGILRSKIVLQLRATQKNNDERIKLKHMSVVDEKLK